MIQTSTTLLLTEYTPRMQKHRMAGMADVRKGQLTASKKWAKHLRFLKRFFWKAERKEARRQLREETKARPPRRAFDFLSLAFADRPHGEERSEAARLEP